MKKQKTFEKLKKLLDFKIKNFIPKWINKQLNDFDWS